MPTRSNAEESTEQLQVDCGCDHSTGFRLPQHRIRFLLLLTALIAVWLAVCRFLTYGSHAVVAIIALTFLFGCWKTRRAVLVMIPCIYLPYGWLVWETNYPWSNYRWQWIGMWPQLPGLIAEIPVHPQNDLWFHIITATASCSIFLTVVLLGRISRYWLIGTAAVVTIASVCLGQLSYALFRM